MDINELTALSSLGKTIVNLMEFEINKTSFEDRFQMKLEDDHLGKYIYKGKCGYANVYLWPVRLMENGNYKMDLFIEHKYEKEEDGC